MENEVWKDIEGYEGIYQVSSLGRVRSLDRVRIRPHYRTGTPVQWKIKSAIITPDCDGIHSVVGLYSKKRTKFRVDKLVAKAFVKQLAGQTELVHIDGNPYNNRADNLKWADKWSDKDGEVWKDIDGYEGIYQVSSIGRVRSLDRVYIMKNGRPYSRKGILTQLFEDKDGYKEVKFCLQNKRKTYKVHRLVAQAFIENPHNLPFINHKDEDKQNNRVENLEWCTPKYNANYGMSKAKLSASHKNHPGLSNPVNQYTMDGIFVQSWPSAKEAQRQTGIYAVNIASCCKGIYKQSHGFIWRYADSKPMPEKQPNDKGDTI